MHMLHCLFLAGSHPFGVGMALSPDTHPFGVGEGAQPGALADQGRLIAVLRPFRVLVGQVGAELARTRA